MTDLEHDNYVYPGTRFTRCGAVSGQGQGMTMRDAFAMSMDRDEYGDLSFRYLSREAKEILAGPRPEKPADNAPRAERVEWQLTEAAWEMRVRAAIRFIYADAMIAARETKET